MLFFFYAGLFTSFKYLNTMESLEIKDNTLTPVKNQVFFLATLTPSFLNFKYIQVLEFSSS